VHVADVVAVDVVKVTLVVVVVLEAAEVVVSALLVLPTVEVD